MCSTCPGVRQLKNSTRHLIPTQNRSFSGTRTLCDVCWHFFEVCLFHFFIQVSNSKVWTTYLRGLNNSSLIQGCLSPSPVFQTIAWKPTQNDDGQPEWIFFKMSIFPIFRRRPFRAKRWVRHISSCCWENMVANLKAKNHMELVYLELFKVKATLEKDTVWVEIVVVVVEEET